MQLSTPIQCFERSFPSANITLIRTQRPLLIDTGFGSDFTALVHLLEEAGVHPQHLTLIINTHYHCDHVGGNHGFQTQYHVPIAAYESEARLINRRDRHACAAEWLGQPIQPYTVNRLLHDSEEIDAGELTLQVIHTPGHTRGHIALYEPESGGLICGDAFHSNDVAWLNIFREGVDAIDRIMASLDKLAKLPLKWSFSGHSPVTDQPLAAIDAARRRYESWLSDPQKIGWHACKRIFSYALMLTDGMGRDQIDTFLLQSPWFLDYSRFVFDVTPQDFVMPLVEELLRSGAAFWRDDRLMAAAPYIPPTPDFDITPARPDRWHLSNRLRYDWEKM